MSVILTGKTKSIQTSGISAGDAGWKDLVQSFNGAKVAGAKQPSFTPIVGGIGAYSFSASTENELVISFHINHDFKVGSAIYPHIHWAPATTGGGKVRWGIEYTWAMGHNQQNFSAPVTVYIEQTAPGIVHRHMIAEVADPGITLTGLEPDSLILARVFRDAAHANDTYTGAVFGFMSDMHYQADHVASLNRKPNFYA
jgi:hypothetical protein